MKLVHRLMGLLLILINSNLYAQKIKVACVGNSVTAGYLLASPQQESYPAQLKQMLGSNYEVGNFGHSGATLLKQGHRPYFQMPEFADLLRFDADIAVIHLGLNDTDSRNWPNYKDRFRADYQWLLDTLKHNNPKLKIFICKLTPIFSGHPRFKSGTRDWYWHIQDEIAKVAEANCIPLINLNTPLANRPDLFSDNLHPDKTGAGIIAKAVYQAITGNFDGFMLNPFFADHMVLQRNGNIPVYGKANAGDRIVVKFNQLTRSIVADNTGSWIAEFPAMKAGGPYNLEATCGNRKAMVNDILIGDVWLCSGQSNMAFPLKAAATGQQTLSHLPKELPLRFLKYNVIAETDNVAWDERTLNKVNNLEYFSGTWNKIDSASVRDFSAVAYYFGEKIARDEHVSIGLIELAVGGSPIESWIDRRTLENDNLLVDLIDPWRKSDFIQDWVRGRADVNLKNAGNPKQRHPYSPAYNYEAGVARLIQSPIAGVIWYQGESNAHNAELYSYELPVLVKSWRQQWKQNFPFYYVQLSSINRTSWPFFRDTQRRLEAVIPQSAMAVSSDLGDSLNVHPTQKKQIGERLALLALKNTYRHHIIDRGPAPLSAFRRRNIVDISFASAKTLQPADGRQIKGFEVEDDKGKHWTVVATVSGNHVLLSTPGDQKLIRVLYGWQPFTRANLVNEARLPASTFSLPL